MARFLALLLVLSTTTYHSSRLLHAMTGKKRWLAITVIGAGLAGIVGMPWAYLRVLSYGVWIAGLAIRPREAPSNGDLRLRLAKGVLLAGLLLAIFNVIPSLWVFLA